MLFEKTGSAFATAAGVSRTLWSVAGIADMFDVAPRAVG